MQRPVGARRLLGTLGCMNRAITRAAVFLACAYVPPVTAQGSLGPGENCDLQKPPATAHRTPLHGNELVLFPVAPGLNYNGCSWSWVMSGGVPHLEDVARFQGGQLVFYRRTMRSTQPLATECTYAAGKVTKRVTIPSTWRGDDCPSAESMRTFLTERPN
jgi:hypothetical protein